jgi:hypothetical protein
MCLDIKDLKWDKAGRLILIPKARVANRDIKVFKQLDIESFHPDGMILTSPHRGHRWYAGKLKKANMRVNSYGEVHQGLHAYRKLGDCPSIRFHAIIPKGAKYYIGNDGDIVANKMKVLGPVYAK